MRIHPTAVCLGLSIATGFVLPARAAYDVTPLHGAGGQGFNEPVAINASGQSVGYAATASGGYLAVLWSSSGRATVLDHSGSALAIDDSRYSVGSQVSASGTYAEAVRWSPTGTITYLQDAGAQGRSEAVATNDSGQSVGISGTASGWDAVLWSPSGKATVLQDAGGQGDSQAVALNASGESVGYSATASGGQDAVLWSSSGTATVLTDAGGLGTDYAVAINVNGQSIGNSKTASGQEAVLWSSTGAATVLASVGNQGFSGAVAINASGESVGFCLTTQGQDAMLWSPTGGATVLKDPGGEGVSAAVAINASGRSVGYAETANGDEAVLWQPSGKATNLGALLGSAWSDTQAVAINDVGDIIGYGEFHGAQRGFLLFSIPSAPAFAAGPFAPAVPELSTWAMMLVGFAGLGGAGYNCSRKPARRPVDASPI
jgi:hypothetical protein